MWPFRKSMTLGEKVLGTKKIIVENVTFHIKKINILDHLEGYKVMLKTFETYQREGAPKDVTASDLKKLKAHYRDIILCGVVSPEIKMKNDARPGIFVDEIFNEWEMAEELYTQIVMHSYDKKKPLCGGLPGKQR